MKNYHDLMQHILDHGEDQFNVRTGLVCRAIAGHQLQFDLREGFPAITTKKLAFNAAKGELLGFFRGYDNAADFRALGCNIWNDNANKTPGWLANPYRRGEDHLSRIYGVQWTAWVDRRIADTEQERDRLLALGYTLRMTGDGEWLLQRTINQLEAALHKLLTDPSDRRIIVSGWNVAELDMMALPPCHMDYRFIAFDGDTPDAKKTLHLVMTQRSVDTFLGLGFNQATSALFLSIMARLANMNVGTLTMQLANVHIYENHYDQVREQLQREHFAPPTLYLSPRIRAIDSLDEIAGAFARIEPNDIILEDYQSHAAIKAPMAV